MNNELREKITDIILNLEAIRDEIQDKVDNAYGTNFQYTERFEYWEQNISDIEEAITSLNNID